MQSHYAVDARGGSVQGGASGAPGRGGASRGRGGAGRRKTGGPKQEEKRGKYDHSKLCHLGLCLEGNGKLLPKKRGSDKCVSCCNNVARARRVAIAQECVKWFEDMCRRSTAAAAASGKGQPDPEFLRMMKEFTSSCPAQGRGRTTTGLFDMGRYMESSVASSGVEMWAEGEYMTQSDYFDWLATKRGGLIVDKATQMDKWNALLKNPRIKPKYGPGGALKLPVITADRFKFFNGTREEHAIQRDRKVALGLGPRTLGFVMKHANS